MHERVNMNLKLLFELLCLKLTHFNTMFHLYSPLKNSGGMEMEFWTNMGCQETLYLGSLHNIYFSKL